MEMNTVKHVLEQLLAAMDDEDKALLKDKLMKAEKDEGPDHGTPADPDYQFEDMEAVQAEGGEESEAEEKDEEQKKKFPFMR